MSMAWLLNTAWMLRCLPEASAFHKATRRVAETQISLLADILRNNRDTEFGRAHAFDRIRTPADYQERVPLSCHDDYADAIHCIAVGRPSVLTREPVTLLEPTSGTTGGEKLIPYTAALRRQFQRAVAVWIADLFRARPALRGGRAYWSVSPALGPPRRTAGGIPVGFEDDAAYLGAPEQFALRRLLVVPAAVARLADMELFRYVTLFHLLKAADLALISVWSPTFLTALFARFEEQQERLCADVAAGGPPACPACKPDAARAAHLLSIFRSGMSLPEKLCLAWPRLALISCWADAAAAHCLGEMRALFPGVEVQPKGLLATEGCVSFPLLGRPAPVLAVRSHFFEFQPAPDATPCRLAHELDRGGRYRVVLTTGGGLYRYQLRDEVEVVGFENQCPLLRFLGKADRVSDIVGEKLAEPHVRAVLGRVFATLGLAPRFALLVPAPGPPRRYRLYLQDARVADSPEASAALEDGLCENPYYRHAVGMGQLAPSEVWFLDPEGESAWSIYERRCLGRGQKAGGIKPAALDPWTGWVDEFRPLLLEGAPAR